MKTEIHIFEIGFLGLLALLFIGLKLTNYINWSWWWILAPIWIPFSLGIIIALMIIILFLFEVLKQ